jgi:hypothetical protein
MKSLLNITVLTAVTGLCIVLPNQASACWCGRVYTSYYQDPCVSCPTVACPTAACATASVSCGTSDCYVPCAQRCYLEPQVASRLVTRLEPQTFYVRRSYYDPIGCCERSYYLPAVQLVERAYEVPVVSYVQRCYGEPSNGSSSQPVRNGYRTDRDQESPAPQPSERGGPGLDRPIYREPEPKSEPAPPKPVPMPRPQASRGQLIMTNSQPIRQPAARLAFRPEPPAVYWPPVSLRQ